MGNSEHDPLDTAGNEAAEKQQAERQRDQQLETEEDLRWLMGDERGRRFMWRLLGMTKVFRNAFTGDSRTFFQCGEQNIGHQLMGQLHSVCPGQYHRMVKEQSSDRKR